MLSCVSISVVLCAGVGACIHCVHVFSAFIVSVYCRCGVVSDCIELMSSLRTVMTLLACVYSVMMILRWRERFSNPFKHDSAHNCHSYQGIRSE